MAASPSRRPPDKSNRRTHYGEITTEITKLTEKAKYICLFSVSSVLSVVISFFWIGEVPER